MARVRLEELHRQGHPARRPDGSEDVDGGDRASSPEERDLRFSEAKFGHPQRLHHKELFGNRSLRILRVLRCQLGGV